MSIKVLLGVSGGIAAYKAAELVRRLREEGAQVRVVMTTAALSFITPLTLQALSGNAVRSDLLDPRAEAGMDHIELARWADLVLVAPATADLMARLAAGLADDLLTTLVLATTAPLVLAPAMNHRMWLHPATRENLARLQKRGVRVLGPAQGDQACGEWGPGRMLEPTEILDVLPLRVSSDLAGKRVMVTAGPTREALDPVRYIGNRSSGRMGYALASSLAARGAELVLVSGPSALSAPHGVDLVRVETALEMEAAVMERIGDCDLFVAAAAVSDYRPRDRAGEKIKKDRTELDLHLVKNPDILARVAALPEGPFTVGFAAETERLEEHALDKLEKKGLNMIAANLVGGRTGGFERNDNALLVLWSGGRKSLPLMSKTRLADALTDVVVERYLAYLSSQDS
ncbi:MAG: bifunctional phosphopantothenoylcysteine decarboxylase/phosphopantothenate--cysteine ligase CoaBC [Chromatiaceae bacterium]|jgi:phosphopantothenoylcysteine decarboxylase/phosphopantothenate--cysteine ligase|nr:bifunctional phosphopantothenoylcysteine decarboxylase/phosphopantothenate--cysteine ligase CoaBC [Chromatiaceae bacterium]